MSIEFLEVIGSVEKANTDGPLGCEPEATETLRLG